METKSFDDLFEVNSDDSIMPKMTIIKGGSTMVRAKISGGVFWGIPFLELPNKVFIGDTTEEGFIIDSIE